MTTKPTPIEVVQTKDGFPTDFDWYQNRYTVASIVEMHGSLYSLPEFGTVQFYNVWTKGGPAFTMFKSGKSWYVYGMTP